MGLYSMPYWWSGLPTAPVVFGMSFAGSGVVGVLAGSLTIKMSGLMKWVIVASGSRKSMTLVRYWLSWASSSGVSTASGGRTAFINWYASRIHFFRISSSG